MFNTSKVAIAAAPSSLFLTHIQIYTVEEKTLNDAAWFGYIIYFYEFYVFRVR